MLQLEGVSVRYGMVPAVAGVDLQVAPGEWVVVIGANGAGKTSLLRGVMGLAQTSGKILWQGMRLDRLPPWHRSALGIGYVPEGRGIFADLTVEENLRLGGYRLGRQALREGLDQVYAILPLLAERRRQLAGTLSGGEQQLLALGRALVSRPRLLLVDEPSWGLMPKMVAQVFATLAQLHREGMGILMVEQNARKALVYAQRGYVLELGRVALQGPAVELRRHPRVLEAYIGG